MVQQLTRQLSILSTIEEEPVKQETTYSKNGIIFKSLSQSLKVLSKASNSFADSLLQAIESEIWMGFIHPQTGRLVSFIEHNSDGEIDHSLSFKLWLSAPPDRGGLGISDLGVLEGLLLSNRPAYEKTLPLLLNSESIKKANEIRESRGEAPLVSISRNREILLKKINKYPVIQQSLLSYHLNLKFTYACCSFISKQSEPEQNRILKVIEDTIAQNPPKDDLENLLAELTGTSVMRVLKFLPDDPEYSAMNIIKSCKDSDKVRAIAQSLLSHLENDDNPDV